MGEFFVGLLILWGISALMSFLGKLGNGVNTSSYGGQYSRKAELKLLDEKLPDSEVNIKKIQLRGRLNNSRAMDLSYSISAFDITEGEDNKMPILSYIEQAQEEETICFHLSQRIGEVDPGSYLPDWVNVGVIIPDMVQPPFSGDRRIEIVVRIFNTANPPIIRGGWNVAQGEIISVLSAQFSHIFTEVGYEEESKNKEESQAISLKIGIATAMADGSLDDTEGEVLKNWILREVSSLSEESAQRLKTIFNNALKEGYEDARNNNLSVDALVKRLAEIGNKKSKYDAIELCLDVMAADGVADANEMVLIRDIATKLDLNMIEIERMREKVTLNLSGQLNNHDGLESLVGIDKDWTKERKRKHLASEFQKWSNRLNSLPEGEERASAQQMLNNIAELRKKYG